MRFLKQSSAVNVAVGPLVDETDGVTPITSVTLGDITAAVIKGVSRGSLTLVASGDNHFTHIGDGYWELNLTATDTDTLGSLRATLRDDDGFLPVWEDFSVLPANVYDSLVAGSDKLQTDAVEINGSASTAGSLGAEVHLAKAMVANRRVHTISTGVDQVYDDDGLTVLRTMTPTDGGNDAIDVVPS